MKRLPTPDEMARELRSRFEKLIPKRAEDSFFMSVWQLCKVVQEQCGVSFADANVAITAHFAELYAEFWYPELFE